MLLSVIDGHKKNMPDYFTIYNRIYNDALRRASEKLDSSGELDAEDLKRIVFSGVKMIAHLDDELDYGIATLSIHLIHFITDCASKLTPMEFQTIFPIEKTFDGDKYQMKDYFYTKRYIDSFGPDRVIGEDIMEFLWEYHNRDIGDFVVKTMLALSAIRKAEGKRSLGAELAEIFGLTVYTMQEDHKGRKYLTNTETGETFQVRKPIPRYLKLV